MANTYSVGVKTATTTVTTTARTQMALVQAAASMRRAELQEFAFGQADAPNSTDCDVLWDLIRLNADTAGTPGTSLSAANTPRLDTADADPTCTIAHSYSAEPTTFGSAALFELAINQRGAWRWVGRPGYFYVLAATASFKLALRALSPNYASFTSPHMMWSE